MGGNVADLLSILLAFPRVKINVPVFFLSKRLYKPERISFSVNIDKSARSSFINNQWINVLDILSQ